MTLKRAEHIAALNAIIAEIDVVLLQDPVWRSLGEHNASVKPATQTSEQIFKRLRLEQALSQNVLYRIRIRLVEAVQMLQQYREAETAGASAEVARDSAIEVAGNDPELSPQPYEKSSEQYVALDEGNAPVALHRAPAQPDDLTRIKGISTKLHQQLQDLGVTRFEHIANWTTVQRNAISATLGLGRTILQQSWIEQAAILRSAQAGFSDPVHSEPVASSVTVQPAPVCADTSAPQAVQTAFSAIKPLERPSKETAVPHSLIAQAAHGVLRRLDAPHNDNAQSLVSNAAEPASVLAQPLVADQIPTHKRQESAPRPLEIVPPPSIEPSQPVEDITLVSEEQLDAGISQTAIAGLQSSPEALSKRQRKMFLLRRAKTKRAKRMSYRNQRKQKTTDDVDKACGDIAAVAEQADLNAPVQTGQLQTGGQEIECTQVGQSVDESRSSSVPVEGSQIDYAISPLVAPAPVRDTPQPPPLPPTQQQPAGGERFDRQTSRITARRPGPDDRSKFGDGNQWRSQEAVFYGPDADSQPIYDQKFYTHGEEASVQIVRRGEPVNNFADRQVGGQSDGSRSEQPADEHSRTDQPDHSSNPASRMFRALKRD